MISAHMLQSPERLVKMMLLMTIIKTWCKKALLEARDWGCRRTKGPTRHGGGEIMLLRTVSYWQSGSKETQVRGSIYILRQRPGGFLTRTNVKQ